MPSVLLSEEAYYRYSRSCQEAKLIEVPLIEGDDADLLRKFGTRVMVTGIIVRDIEATFTDDDGRCLISKSAVSEIAETLWEDYIAFSQKVLSCFEVAYIFLDAVYEPMRMYNKGRKEGILCAWAILVSGEKVLLHMDLDNKES